MPNIKISLRTLRAELDMTQEQFADFIGMPISTYRKKEKGETQFTLEEAYKIALQVNKSIDEIFFDKK